MKRFSSVLAVVAMTISLTAGPALADRPVKESFSVVGDQVVCGDEVLTAISGEIVGITHEHELPSGRVRVIFAEHPENVVFEDESGNTFRAVGAGNGNFTIDPEVGEGSEVGRVIFNINLIGEHGKLGDLRFRVRVTRDGEFSFVDKGSCQFVEE